MSLSSELGCSCVTLTPALMAAAASYRPPPRGVRVEQHSTKHALIPSDPLPLLIARAPQKVPQGRKAVSCRLLHAANLSEFLLFFLQV